MEGEVYSDKLLEGGGGDDYQNSINNEEEIEKANENSFYSSSIQVADATAVGGGNESKNNSHWMNKENNKLLNSPVGGAAAAAASAAAFNLDSSSTMSKYMIAKELHRVKDERDNELRSIEYSQMNSAPLFLPFKGSSNSAWTQEVVSQQQPVSSAISTQAIFTQRDHLQQSAAGERQLSSQRSSYRTLQRVTTAPKRALLQQVPLKVRTLEIVPKTNHQLHAAQKIQSEANQKTLNKQQLSPHLKTSTVQEEGGDNNITHQKLTEDGGGGGEIGSRRGSVVVSHRPSQLHRSLVTEDPNQHQQPTAALVVVSAAVASRQPPPPMIFLSRQGSGSSVKQQQQQLQDHSLHRSVVTSSASSLHNIKAKTVATASSSSIHYPGVLLSTTAVNSAKSPFSNSLIQNSFQLPRRSSIASNAFLKTAVAASSSSFQAHPPHQTRPYTAQNSTHRQKESIVILYPRNRESIGIRTVLHSDNEGAGGCGTMTNNSVQTEPIFSPRLPFSLRLSGLSTARDHYNGRTSQQGSSRKTMQSARQSLSSARLQVGQSSGSSARSQAALASEYLENRYREYNQIYEDAYGVYDGSSSGGGYESQVKVLLQSNFEAEMLSKRELRAVPKLPSETIYARETAYLTQTSRVFKYISEQQKHMGELLQHKYDERGVITPSHTDQDIPATDFHTLEAAKAVKVPQQKRLQSAAAAASPQPMNSYSLLKFNGGGSSAKSNRSAMTRKIKKYACKFSAVMFEYDKIRKLTSLLA